MLSPASGRFVPSTRIDFTGRYFQRGQTVGYVIDDRRMTVLTAVSQRHAERVSADRQSLAVRLADEPQQTHQMRVVREIPAATRALPSLVLSLEGGGNIGLDPQSREQSMPLALEPVFLLELAPVNSDFPADAIGQRAYVRIGHSPEPLGIQIYRVIRDIFLERFMI